MRLAEYEQLKAWQTRKSAGEAVAPFYIYKASPSEVTKSLGESNVPLYRFTISTETPDRSSDTVSVRGWKLDNFLRNAVVPFAHSYNALPVGKAHDTRVEGERLRSSVQFVPRDISEFAESVRRMVDEGYLSTASVGFDPIEWVENHERQSMGWFTPLDFQKQELLEWSIVPIPANPEALIDAKAKGINTAPLAKWAEEVLDGIHGERGLWLPRKMLEDTIHTITTRSVHGGVTLTKGALPYHESAKADEGASWDGPAEVAAAEVDDLKAMCCFSTGDGTLKGDYHLPHHEASGDHAVVWAGVKAAWGRRSQTNGASEYMSQIESHLKSHASQWGKTLESGDEGKSMTRAAGRKADDEGAEQSLGAVAIAALNAWIAQMASDLGGDPEDARGVQLLLSARAMCIAVEDDDLDDYWYLGAHGAQQKSVTGKSGKVISGVNASDIQAAHRHIGTAMGHLQSVMDKGGIEPDAGALDNNTEPVIDDDGDVSMAEVAEVLKAGLERQFNSELMLALAAKTGRLSP